MEIDPTPRGIIFSLLGLPGGSKIKKQKQNLENSKKKQKSPSLLSAYAGDIILGDQSKWDPIVQKPVSFELVKADLRKDVQDNIAEHNGKDCLVEAIVPF